MSLTNQAQELARAWIEGWSAGKPDDIPLASNFTHTSPFGVISGRERYLAWVKPLAAKNVSTLEILKTLGGENEAVINFVMSTPSGPVHVCDWVKTNNGEIVAVTSYYHEVEIIATQVKQAQGQTDPTA